ncbi:MAG: dTDP-glucose 4,6-dehydratase [Lentisphaeria bacterium]|jgi:dTDP-glucose 4,6-dehydratase|nr:dTDP-glucose 4,6-dehydratase [Lentisphaeria bacterium]
MGARAILVTGGAGFIGSNFVRLLLAEEAGLTVVNLDALTYAGHRANLADCLDHPRHVFVQGDIRDAGLVAELVRRHGIEGILNFAAESHVDRSISGPQVFVETNVGGTLNLLVQARDLGLKRFLQVSTDEVYGSLGAAGRFTENSPLAPNSPYSASKAGADHLVHAFHHTYGLDTVIVRSSNNYGPYQFPEKLIPLAIRHALADQPVPVYGSGANVRDWLHVEDNCRAIWAAYTRGRAGEVYNVGGGNERTNLEVVRAILARLGKPTSLVAHVADRPGHDLRYAVDAGKIARELGWHPAVDFADGIARTVDWYREHREWIEQVAVDAGNRDTGKSH